VWAGGFTERIYHGTNGKSVPGLPSNKNVGGLPLYFAF